MIDLPHMENCLFCKIVAGEIPAQKVYEDAGTIAFLDIKPVNPGHTLVIPKEHYANIFETPDSVTSEMLKTVKKIAHGIQKGLGIEHINITMNNGIHAGQSVFHAHIHLIPRHEGDGHRAWHGTHAYTEGEALEIVEKIKKAL